MSKQSASLSQLRKPSLIEEEAESATVKMKTPSPPKEEPLPKKEIPKPQKEPIQLSNSELLTISGESYLNLDTIGKGGSSVVYKVRYSTIF